jgi:uncharacterized membrane protein YqiK
MILRVVIMCTFLIFILTFALIYNQEPSKTITICDKSHEEEHTSMMPVFNGYTTVFIPTYGIKTVCDESHIEDNPKYLEWKKLK